MRLFGIHLREHNSILAAANLRLALVSLSLRLGNFCAFKGCLLKISLMKILFFMRKFYQHETHFKSVI